ncbi:MAG: hypothetical protein UT51_C0009G0015 [Candidatus Nomurabacteria bacterium GW2011_GWC2_39_41]|uniref:Portal protein n=1 Tax=Candidatus Nomurabacteria bacterium GW2011_GWC2_39_41 TaxID=1618754 RepID=A0A837I0M9_9BACT|nr:MAG: hypothetical protein UT51_C0009G0015 [Candidatus Nomurabacteria bacterium GW2011_GWC2_39_41]
MPETQIQINESLMDKLVAEKTAANELQKRKHEDWNDNYELYRNKVKTNRLTQRQAVNIPLMKETIKTILSKIDDAPNAEWKEMGGNEDKELIYQEIWDAALRENKLELIDILDKKNVLLYGLSAKKLNIGDTGVSINVLDVYDIVYDPLMSASDSETAKFIIHQNIFRSIREILADDRYAKNGKDELMSWVNSEPGLTQSEENKKNWELKMERLKDMGVDHQDFSLFVGGDRLVNLTEHYTNIWNIKKKEWERKVVVYADDHVELLNETLMDLTGVDFWPFIVWSEDPEINDIYPDSVADLVRTPNKVLNVWFSQMIENRTLKNFQMHWFLPGQNYTPQTYTPGPGVMLPAPPGDDINKVIKPVEISGLDDTLTAISALTQIVERGTGATAIEKGQPEKGVQTLGEVQILVGKAMERSIGIAKFYKMAWHETCWKWDKLMHANAPKILKLYKTSRTGKIYSKKIYASDWKSTAGYEPMIRSSSEQEQESLKTIQKFMFLLAQFPNNEALRKIAQKRMLESVDLSSEELKQVESSEEKQQQQPQQQEQEQSPQGFAEIQNKMGELAALSR